MLWGLQGSQSIVAKLTSLPFQKCQHHISSVDTQPSLSGGILVFVTGQLMVHPLFPPQPTGQTESSKSLRRVLILTCCWGLKYAPAMTITMVDHRNSKIAWSQLRIGMATSVGMSST